MPASARKLVQGLKEIVNRPDAEIYAALRECGMTPTRRSAASCPKVPSLTAPLSLDVSCGFVRSVLLYRRVCACVVGLDN